MAVEKRRGKVGAIVFIIIVHQIILTIDGNREFSVDQLKRKQLLPTFRPDALVVFRAQALSLEDD